MTDYDPATHGDVDIIFAGGGTAACVAAGRLAKHNPDLRILLIERGPNSFENPAVRNPVLYPTHLLPDSKTALVSRIPRFFALYCKIQECGLIANFSPASSFGKLSLPSTSISGQSLCPQAAPLAAALPLTS